MVDFNADLGESFGTWDKGADGAMLGCITSANVACGFHAGDPVTMAKTVKRIKTAGIAVGAHPGYPDLLGFGRRNLGATPEEIEAYVIYQVGALEGFTRSAGLNLHHVKPHGALYVTALTDPAVARAVARATAAVLAGGPIYTLPGSAMWRAAEELGLRPVAEFFADRPLLSDGSYEFFRWREIFDLDPTKIAARVVRAIKEGTALSVDGQEVKVDVETVCLHSDTPGAAELGPIIRAALVAAEVDLKATSN